MMAALAGVSKEADKEITRKLFRLGDVNRQVDDVSKLTAAVHKAVFTFVYCF